MVALPLLSLVLATSPAFEVAPELQPQTAISREANAAWHDLEATWTAATHTALPAPAIRLERARSLKPDQAGRSRFGVIELRQSKDGQLTEAMVTALRHELAHQLLLSSCRAGSGDALFQEAFAVATSGELSAWTDGPYLSMNAARRQLAVRPLDSADGRAALARLLANSAREGGLPRPLATRLRRCADGASWVPLTTEELIAIPIAEGDAWVVLNRHSGEVLQLEGDAQVPLPFGSTLKPLLAAAFLDRAPKLQPRAGKDEWACGEELPHPMDLGAALARSCNGYFLDWAARDPEVARLGSYGPLLLQLGLARLPEDGSEAIGLRPTLRLSPVALAQAYRVLADAQPAVLDMLREVPLHGTLAGLEASPRLQGLALKTGTVRDADSRVELGWIVAVDDDLVAVMVRKGQMPRSFAGDLAELLAPLRHRREQADAEVQVLGLLPAEEVEARCAGLAVSATPQGPKLLDAATVKLTAVTHEGRALCLGAPWMVRFPGGPKSGRPYAGSFRFDAPPPYRPPPGSPPLPERARRAREGSSFIFSTRLLLYTSGVLASEDAQIAGEPRIALARAIAHNAASSRHPGRPVCDTTHCQVFQGTTRPEPADSFALAGSDPAPSGWLPFSQGGDEPWTETRPLERVARVLGARPQELSFTRERVRFRVTVERGDGIFEDLAEQPCESLRNGLQLPACPEQAELLGAQVRFHGRGRGHGLGLDVEKAKRSDQDASSLLREAYGAPR